MKLPVCFSARAKAAPLGKVAVLALAMALTAGAGGRAHATAQDSAATAQDSALAPAEAAPAVAAPAVAAPAAPGENATQVFGPQKPAANIAIRAALDRAAAQPMAADQRAIFRAVDAFYADHGDAPVYFGAEGWTAQARGVFEQLQQAAADGLDLRAWRVYSLDPAPASGLAAGEVALAQAAAAYAFQASGGRIEPWRMSKLIGLRPEVVSVAQALEETSQAADAGAQLASYNPPQQGYRALRDKLAELRANPGGARLAATEHKRRASDARSLAGVAARRATEEADLRVNMEFWRWMPRELGADRIMVNIPEFVARLYRNDQLADTHRIVVGKPNTPTPMFSDRMEYLVVNPSWYVPQSIIRKDMGGRAPNGFDSVWRDGVLHVRQPPGERNALGRIKFIFPNAYAVYMHDTPARHLFAQAKRAYSHGCMRVDQPLQWAVDILGADKGWTPKRIEKMYGKSERRVTLPAPLPIHIGYFTERVDEAGELHAFADVYGYAAEVRKRLGLGG
jgi:murein L,D-transpeptidase YcbB/YkuD